VLIVATAGHVDHGKSTLVRALTSMEPDRLAEERRRGLTIELGHVSMTTRHGTEVAFVDVPGHRRFIRTMLSGVGAIDACLFVVDATEGWKPQSEEHLRILDLLGHERGVVALTKVDAVDEATLHQRLDDLAVRLGGTFLATAPVVALSARDGTGLHELEQQLERLAARPTRTDGPRSRLWVDRSFVIPGAGTVVTGTLSDGSVTVGDELAVVPGGRTFRTRTMESLRHPVRHVGAGTRLAVGLSNATTDQVPAGAALVTPYAWHQAHWVDAQLTVLPGLGHDLSRRGAFAMYLGSAGVRVQLRVLQGDSIAPGATGLVRLHLGHGLAAQPGDRFVLRDDGRSETVGGGQVLELDPPTRASVSRPALSIEATIGHHGWIDADDLYRRTGERRTPTVGRWVVAPDAWERSVEDLTAAVAEGGPAGLAAGELDERSAAVARGCDAFVVEGGRVRAVGEADELAQHPVVIALRASPFDPPPVDDVDPDLWRELVRRGLVVRRGGVTFAGSSIDLAARLLAPVLDGRPEGITVADARNLFGSTRRVVVPLLEELDARGVTVRRDDRRTARPGRGT